MSLQAAAISKQTSLKQNFYVSRAHVLEERIFSRENRQIEPFLGVLYQNILF